MSANFRTTRWSIVSAAGRPEEPKARAALETLCSLYWYPLYAYARRRGYDEETSRDLTQGFFTALLEKNWVASADAERGRFRAFLITAFKRFLGREHARKKAQKRGGDETILSLDFTGGERRYALEPSHDTTAESIFDRTWALTVLGRALSEIEAEMEATDRTELFAALKPLIGGAGEVPAYRDLAEQVGMSENAVKVAAHRLRGRYGDRLRRLVADTLTDDGDVDEELRHLLTALAG